MLHGDKGNKNSSSRKEGLRWLGMLEMGRFDLNSV